MRLQQSGGKFPFHHRRDQRAKRGAVTQGDRHAERHAEIAHRQSKRQTTEAPQRTHQIGHPKGVGRGLMQHGQEIFGQCQRTNPRADEPAEHPARQPEGFPRPFADAFVRHVKRAGRQAAQPVIDDTEERIRLHGLNSVFSLSRAGSTRFFRNASLPPATLRPPAPRWFHNRNPRPRRTAAS